MLVVPSLHLPVGKQRTWEKQAVGQDVGPGSTKHLSIIALHRRQTGRPGFPVSLTSDSLRYFLAVAFEGSTTRDSSHACVRPGFKLIRQLSIVPCIVDLQEPMGLSPVHTSCREVG